MVDINAHFSLQSTHKQITGGDRMNSLAQTRKKTGMSQEILAKKVGITRQYLSEIENGKKQPSVIIAVKIAKALNTKVEDIFFEFV